MEYSSSVHEQCHLLRVPDELKLEIVKHVQNRRDLLNLSLACKLLADMTLGRLYKSIDLDVPASDAFKSSQNALPTFRSYVLQNIRHLTIRNGAPDTGNPIYNKRRRSDANTMMGYIGEIVRGAPRDHLQSFSLQHRAPMATHMLTELAKHHGNSLRHLKCCEIEHFYSLTLSLPSNLRTFECRSVLTGEAVAKLVEHNKNTLRSLSLGQDKYILRQYRRQRIGFLNSIPQPFNGSTSQLDIATIPRLKCLSASGLDLSTFIAQTQEPMSCFTQLESLIIESCINTAEFLDTVTLAFDQAQKSGLRPCLTKFSFRHEFFTTSLKNSLIAFLNSFSGLESLTILVENTTMTARPSKFLTNHGATLQNLTLESRIQPRSHLPIDTSRPFGCTAPLTTTSQLSLSNITDITKVCPHLIELGISIPWNDPTLTAQLSHLRSLPNLNTLHIRNFPTSQTQDTLGATNLKSHAADIVQQIHTTTRMTHLAIGPTVYTTRWRLSTTPTNTPTQPTLPLEHLHHYTPRSSIRSISPHSTTSQNPATRRLHAAIASSALLKRDKTYATPPEYLRTHHFAVSCAGDVEAVSGREIEGREKGVFEAVWLR